MENGNETHDAVLRVVDNKGLEGVFEEKKYIGPGGKIVVEQIPMHPLGGANVYIYIAIGRMGDGSVKQVTIPLSAKNVAEAFAVSDHQAAEWLRNQPKIQVPGSASKLIT